MNAESRRLVRFLVAAGLWAGSGCSWFPLVDYPPPPSPAVEEPAKVIDLAIQGAESR